MTASGATLDESAKAELAAARQSLHAPGSLVVRAADAFGRAAGGIGHRMLSGVLNDRSTLLSDIAEAALTRAYNVVLLGMDLPGPPPGASAPLVAASGFAWGLAGIAGFLPDATFTTLMIMREIARIARQNGEDLTSDEGRAACLQVFALRAGDESGYFASRLILDGAAARGLLSRLAAAWGAVLGDKFAAQAVPLAGALAGAAVNAAFLDHYRRLASAHFTIRRLQRIYGALPVEEDARFIEEKM
jgi:hypothetical protein